jgi:hypothetical protein
MLRREVDRQSAADDVLAAENVEPMLFSPGIGQ